MLHPTHVYASIPLGAGSHSKHSMMTPYYQLRQLRISVSLYIEIQVQPRSFRRNSDMKKQKDRVFYALLLSSVDLFSFAEV